MKTLLTLSLGLFLFACSDYPTKDENNPTEITVNIVNESVNNNTLNDPGSNQSEWQTYRQALRDITTQTPSLDENGQLTGIT